MAQKSVPLGYNTKSSSPPPIKFAMSPLVFDAKSKIKRSRWDRFRLLATARMIYNIEGDKLNLEYSADFHRTAKCHLVPVKGKVDVHQSLEHGTAFYSGLAVCGNVWTCPVCSAKIQERRRLEVAQGMDWAYDEGYKCIMVTLTMPHTRFDSLKSLLEVQTKSLKLLRSGKAWEKIKGKMGFQALIRSLELTHGENGWHPHTHELWIVDKNADVEEIREKVVERWYNVCKKSGLEIGNKEAFDKHSVDIIDNASNSEYLAKMDNESNWGIDRELVKGTLKGSHPFSLLERVYNGDKKAINLWLEYTEGMHGKRQLYWSQGLKKRVGILDKKDQEIANETEDEAILLATLSLQDWKIITKWGLQSELLDCAEDMGVEGIKLLLRRWGDVEQ